MPVDLFADSRRKNVEKAAPLAVRLRPRTLDEFVGQQHFMAEGTLLRRMIQADRLTSLIFYGPPGTGKTTLGQIIADTTQSHFELLNASSATVKDVRAMGTVLDAAVKGHRVLERNEASTLLFLSVLTCGVAALFFWFPKAIAYPIVVFLAWVGLSLMVQALKLRFGKTPPDALDEPDAPRAIDPVERAR